MVQDHSESSWILQKSNVCFECLRFSSKNGQTRKLLWLVLTVFVWLFAVTWSFYCVPRFNQIERRFFSVQFKNKSFQLFFFCSSISCTNVPSKCFSFNNYYFGPTVEWIAAVEKLNFSFMFTKVEVILHESFSLADQNNNM